MAHIYKYEIHYGCGHSMEKFLYNPRRDLCSINLLPYYQQTPKDCHMPIYTYLHEQMETSLCAYIYINTPFLQT